MGAGVKMNVAYYCIIRDCQISGFDKGVYLKTGVKNIFEGNTYILFNQYGIYIDGGATNINNFKGVGIRENRKAGVWFELNGSPFLTANVFEGCLIETNVPYPYVKGGSGIGIYLSGTYGNIFSNCYSENHVYAVFITGSSDGNIFSNCRYNQIETNDHYDTIMFDGDSLYNNQFIECSGFNFIKEHILSRIDMINSSLNQSGGGTPNKAITLPYERSINNPNEGTGRGRINGIGTPNATINALGYGEMVLGSQISAPTTITNILNLHRGQFFTLSNYQLAHPVTLKASLDGINGLILKDKKDVVFKGYSDSITFYVSQLGKVTEVGRNVTSNLTQSGTVWLTVGNLTITVTHKLGKQPLNVLVSPRGKIGNTWASDVTETTFIINCDKGHVDKNIMVDWRVDG